MTLAGLADAVLADPALAAAMADAAEGRLPANELTGPEPLRPFVVAGLARTGRPVLAVTATTREAEQLVSELGDLIDPATVGYYPSWETLPHERLSPRSDTVGRRLAVLRRLCHPGAEAGTGPLSVVVAPVRSLLQPQVKGLGDLTPVELAVGASADLDDVVASLVGAAYSRVDLVERRGEFAVRGGIVDVFPPTEEHPVRVEFWGDEVEEIRSFAVADQRTIATLKRLWAPPCRELLLTDEVRARAAELGREHPELREFTDKLAEGIAVEGMEALIPALVDELELLVDLLPAETQVLVLDPERARARAHDLVATSEEFLGASWAAAAGGGQAPIDLQAASYRELADVRSHALDRQQSWWTYSPFGLDGGRARFRRARPPGGGSGDRALPRRRGAGVRRHREVAGRRLHGRRGAQRATARPSGWSRRWGSATYRPDWSTTCRPAARPDADVVTVTCGNLAHGLVDDGLRLVVLTGEDIVGQKASTRDMRAMPVRRKRQIDPLELKPGDYVVHEQHGVGRFREMRQREIKGVTREYLILEYGASKRGGAARPADGPGRRARPGDPLRRRRAAQSRPARRRRLDQAQEPREEGGPRDRGRADQALRRAAGDEGPRVRAGQPVAARARGRVPVPRDPRPADDGRRGQGATWSGPCRWTGWSAATSATARPRSRCGRRSRRCRTASRWRSWCRPRCW